MTKQTIGTSKETRLWVLWHTPGTTPLSRTSAVSLYEGYTDTEDIPRIISIARDVPIYEVCIDAVVARDSKDNT